MPARLRAPPQQEHREGSALRFARADIDLPAVPGHDFLDGVQTKAHAAPRHVHLSTRPLHRFEQPTARLGRNRDTRVVHTQLYLVDPPDGLHLHRGIVWAVRKGVRDQIRQNLGKTIWVPQA